MPSTGRSCIVSHPRIASSTHLAVWLTLAAGGARCGGCSERDSSTIRNHLFSRDLRKSISESTAVIVRMAGGHPKSQFPRHRRGASYGAAFIPEHPREFHCCAGSCDQSDSGATLTVQDIVSIKMRRKLIDSETSSINEDLIR
jgi:hypothetical protein